jgi:hypothetical protein
VSTLLTVIQYSTKIPNQRNKTRERNKRDSNRERRCQLSLFAGNMILYLKDPKDSTKTS